MTSVTSLREGEEATNAERREAARSVVPRTIELASGLRLEYAETGRRAGVPVVFLHGATDSWRSFEPVLDRLPPWIRGLAVSLRGHGRSSRPESGYDYTAMAADVREFLDGLALPATVIVGHSMGSMVAQRFVVDHPERAAGLVLMGAFRTIAGNVQVQDFWDTALATLTDPIDPALAREFQLGTLAREVPAGLLETVVGESRLVPARVWRAIFRAFLDTPDFSAALTRVGAPTLIVWGDHDAYAGEPDQAALRAVLPHAEWTAYRGAGHAPHWEDPDRVTADLVGFVREQVPGAREREQGR
jgi:pimeloyl-ACP methyl ester carboxylesterase